MADSTKRAVGFSAEDSPPSLPSKSSQASFDDSNLSPETPVSKEEKKLRRRSVGGKKTKDLVKAKTLRPADLESIRLANANKDKSPAGATLPKPLVATEESLTTSPKPEPKLSPSPSLSTISTVRYCG